MKGTAMPTLKTKQKIIESRERRRAAPTENGPTKAGSKMKVLIVGWPTFCYRVFGASVLALEIKHDH